MGIRRPFSKGANIIFSKEDMIDAIFEEMNDKLSRQSSLLQQFEYSYSKCRKQCRSTIISPRMKIEIDIADSRVIQEAYQPVTDSPSSEGLQSHAPRPSDIVVRRSAVGRHVLA